MLEGVLTALVTPFRDGAVDERALQDLEVRQLRTAPGDTALGPPRGLPTARRRRRIEANLRTGRRRGGAHPRARIIQQACHDVLRELGIKDDPLLDLAMELEKIALNARYFVDRKLYPNVDFYSGIILKAMGFPTSMFTALFAVSRTVGWVSQWQEMMEDPQQRIGRPRQIYTGPGRRDYVPPEMR